MPDQVQLYFHLRKHACRGCRPDKLLGTGCNMAGARSICPSTAPNNCVELVWCQGGPFAPIHGCSQRIDKLVLWICRICRGVSQDSSRHWNLAGDVCHCWAWYDNRASRKAVIYPLTASIDGDGSPSSRKSCVRGYATLAKNS